MLFNTLVYARFFVLVFIATGMLVHRRYALLLPWLALAGYGIFDVALPWLFALAQGRALPITGQLLALGPLLAATFAVSLWLARREPAQACPRPPHVAASV
ncbi:MAG TPA: hypothetical protein VIV60_19385, partial [Polyangiaceae bacterium]